MIPGKTLDTNNIRTLLGALTTREQMRSGVRKALPFVVGIATLFFSGYFERFLRGDPEGRYLHMYFVLATSAFSLTTFISFAGGSEEILRKSAIFPLHSWTRYAFVFLGALRSPMMVAFWLAGALAIGVLFHAGIGVTAMSIAHFTLLGANALAGTTCAILIPWRWLRSSAPLRALLPLLLLSLVISTSVVDDHLLARVPVMGWATSGIRSAVSGDLASSGVLLGASLCVFLGFLFLGRKAC